jgi:hypothetical protein
MSLEVEDFAGLLNPFFCVMCYLFQMLQGGTDKQLTDLGKLLQAFPSVLQCRRNICDPTKTLFVMKSLSQKTTLFLEVSRRLSNRAQSVS